MENNIQRMIIRHINSLMREAHDLIISDVLSRVEYF